MVEEKKQELREAQEIDWRDKLKKDLLNKYGSIHQAARDLGIPEDTLRDAVKKRTHYFSEPTRKKIYEKTGLEYLSKPFPLKKKHREEKKRVSKRSQLELQMSNVHTSLNNLITLLLPSNKLSEEQRAALRGSLMLTQEARISRVQNLFYALSDELQYFLKNEGAGNELAKLLPQEHAGYLISILNSLYTKDKFKDWVKGVTYPLPKK